MIATLLTSHLSVPCSREATGPHLVETTVVAPEPVSHGIAGIAGAIAGSSVAQPNGNAFPAARHSRTPPRRDCSVPLIEPVRRQDWSLAPVNLTYCRNKAGPSESTPGGLSSDSVSRAVASCDTLSAWPCSGARSSPHTDRLSQELLLGLGPRQRNNQPVEPAKCELLTPDARQRRADPIQKAPRVTRSTGRVSIIAHGKSSGSRRSPASLASIKAAAPGRDTRSAVIAAGAPAAITVAVTIVIVAVATVIAAAAAVIEPTTIRVAAIAPLAAAAVVAPTIVVPTAMAPMPEVAAAPVIPVIASMTTIFATITTRIRPGIGRAGRGAQGDCHAEHNDESTQLPQHDMSAGVELGVTFGPRVAVPPQNPVSSFNHLVSDDE